MPASFQTSVYSHCLYSYTVMATVIRMGDKRTMGDKCHVSRPALGTCYVLLPNALTEAAILGFLHICTRATDALSTMMTFCSELPCILTTARWLLALVVRFLPPPPSYTPSRSAKNRLLPQLSYTNQPYNAGPTRVLLGPSRVLLGILREILRRAGARTRTQTQQDRSPRSCTRALPTCASARLHLYTHARTRKCAQLRSTSHR